MLRVKVGDDAFWKGVRSYYQNIEQQRALPLTSNTKLEATYGKTAGYIFQKLDLQAALSPCFTGKWDYDSRRK